MMRARLGIDKTKAWADWAEEEEEVDAMILTLVTPQETPPINTNELGQTDQALKDLKSQLLEHAARITENVPSSKRLGQAAPGVSAKRPRSSSPASSLSDEGTDTGEPGNRQRKRQRACPKS